MSGLAFASPKAKKVGMIKSIQGKVVIVRDGDRIDAKLNASLYNSDSIRTIKFSKVSIKFNDGTLVHLGKASELKVDDYIYDGKNSKVVLNAKEGLFQVITGKIGKINPNRFNVKTSSVTIGIRGTIFDISNINNQVDIGCFSGGISIIDKSGSSVKVNKGEKITLKHATFNQDDVVKAPHSFFTLTSLDSGYYIMQDINNAYGVVGYEKKGSKIISTFKINRLEDVSFGASSYLEIDKNKYQKLQFLAK
jgi:hypothetical protein